jgi:cell division protein FtsB
MDCVVCKSQNPEGAKYCGTCGVRLDPNFGPLNEVFEASVRREVDSALHRYLKDQKISETDITEHVAKRLIGWVKIVAILFVPLAALAGIFGFKTYTDLKNLAENGKKEIAANIESAREDLAQLKSNNAELHKAYDQLSSGLPAYWYSLGDRYKNGSGVAQDYKKAREWFLKAVAILRMVRLPWTSRSPAASHLVPASQSTLHQTPTKASPMRYQRLYKIPSTSPM